MPVRGTGPAAAHLESQILRKEPEGLVPGRGPHGAEAAPVECENRFGLMELREDRIHGIRELRADRYGGSQRGMGSLNSAGLNSAGLYRSSPYAGPAHSRLGAPLRAPFPPRNRRDPAG